MKSELRSRMGTLPLCDIAEECAKEIGASIKGILGNQAFCLGFHIRNVLDCSAPSVSVISSNPEGAEAVKARNEKLGLHTLNHVLDSLYYPPVTEQPASAATAIVARLTYSMKQRESCHHFDEEGDSKPFKVWGKILPADERRRLAETLAGFDFRYARMGVRERSCLVTLDGVEAEDVSSRLFKSDSAFYNEYVCGAQKLCRRLGIQPSIIAYRSLMAAVHQLGTYADPDLFGTDTVTLMLRPPSTFGYVIGITLISKFTIVGDGMVDILSHCLGHYRDMQQGTCPVANSLPTSVYKRFLYKGAPSNVPGEVASVLARELGGSGIPDEELLMDTADLRATVQSFLSMALVFCDERLEGRSLSYGLILGNAPLMSFWPGPAPRPLVKNKSEFLRIEELAKQVHLLEDPELHCIVIPYVGGEFTSGAQCPAWMFDLADFEEAFSAWPEGATWSRDLRPYVFMTMRYPWAIAAVVGPGSQVRVFCRGQMRAYRDGKGWRLYTDPVSQIKRKYPKWFGDNGSEHGDLLRSVVETALQMSPIARVGSHGGFIAYVPAEEEECKVLLTKERMANVREFEPEDETGRKWLKGRHLLEPSPLGVDAIGHSLDYRTSRLLLRAASLDGATVLCRPRGKVFAFSQRLTYSGASTGAGTKRQTAESFVETMARDHGKKDAFAVAVSSDGPISVFVWDQKNSVRTFAAFKTEE